MCVIRRLVAVAALLATAVAAPGVAKSQSDYPNRPVVLLVPYGPGGVADVGMRMLGDKLSSRLHQEVSR